MPERRPGLPDPAALTVLADGAKWIGEERRQHLRGAEGVLAVSHALQHVAAAALHADPATVPLWTDTARQTLLRDGWSGLEAFPRSEIASLRDYLAPHQGRLNYAERWQEGCRIGSGQMEGTCKNLIGRRLKANAAHWRVRRINRMAGLCCLLCSDQWQTYWEFA